jgi:hypothetical protein
LWAVHDSNIQIKLEGVDSVGWGFYGRTNDFPYMPPQDGGTISNTNLGS